MNKRKHAQRVLDLLYPRLAYIVKEFNAEFYIDDFPRLIRVDSFGNRYELDTRKLIGWLESDSYAEMDEYVMMGLKKPVILTLYPPELLVENEVSASGE